jgi:hypothetical protein
MHLLINISYLFSRPIYISNVKKFKFIYYNMQKTFMFIYYNMLKKFIEVDYNMLVQNNVN